MNRVQEEFAKLALCDVWTIRKQGLESRQIQALQNIVSAYRSADSPDRSYIRSLFRRRHEHCIAAFVFLCIAKLPYQPQESCRDALTALIVQDRRPDFRDWIVLFERLYRTASLHLPDADKVFTEAAAMASEETADLIHRRLKRIAAAKNDE